MSDFLMEEDRNGNPIPLAPDARPLAVTNKTDLSTSAADIVTLNASTQLVRIYAETYGTYIYFYWTGYTATVSATVFHHFIPAGWFVDLLVPSPTTKITGIALGACPRFIVQEYS